MPTSTARIEGVTIRTVNTSRGPADKYLIRADREYETWTRDIAQAAKELTGQDAEITFTEKVNGRFTNYMIDSVLPLRGVAPSNGFEHAAPSPVPQDVKEMRIMRQTAAKVAVAQLALFPPDEQTREALMQLLDFWVDYFENGRPEAATIPTDDIPF